MKLTDPQTLNRYARFALNRHLLKSEKSVECGIYSST